MLRNRFLYLGYMSVRSLHGFDYRGRRISIQSPADSFGNYRRLGVADGFVDHARGLYRVSSLYGCDCLPVCGRCSPLDTGLQTAWLPNTHGRSRRCWRLALPQRCSVMSLRSAQMVGRTVKQMLFVRRVCNVCAIPAYFQSFRELYFIVLASLVFLQFSAGFVSLAA